MAQFIAWKDKAETAEERRRKKALKEQKDALFAALSARCRSAALVGRSQGRSPAGALGASSFSAKRRCASTAALSAVEVATH